MTNGEKIQQDFACEVCEPIIEDDIIHVIFADKKDSAIGFDWSWWNMEHKDPIPKNDLGVDNTPNTISFKEMMDRLNLTTDDIEKEEDLDFEIESLMPSYSNLLKANNQLKKQIEMLKLDRDCDKPSGKWIANAPQYDMLNPQYICSECGNAHTRITPYCEMCGAKMESEDNNTSCQG